MIQVTDWKKVKRFQGRAFTIVDKYTLKFVTLNFQKIIEWSELVSPSSPFFVVAPRQGPIRKRKTKTPDEKKGRYKYTV